MKLTNPWRRFKHVLVGLLKQGGDRRALAWCIALGLTISICPIVGIPTLLCTGVALGFRLNLPLIQAVNYAGGPLQWVLIVPFIRLGERLYGATPIPLSPDEILQHLRQDALGFFQEFSWAGLHAVSAWALVSAPLAVLLFGAAYGILRHRQRAASVRSARS